MRQSPRLPRWLSIARYIPAADVDVRAGVGEDVLVALDTEAAFTERLEHSLDPGRRQGDEPVLADDTRNPGTQGLNEA